MKYKSIRRIHKEETLRYIQDIFPHLNLNVMRLMFFSLFGRYQKEIFIQIHITWNAYTKQLARLNDTLEEKSKPLILLSMKTPILLLLMQHI